MKFRRNNSAPQNRRGKIADIAKAESQNTNSEKLPRKTEYKKQRRKNKTY
jgi:hypothetical protein